MSQIGLKIQWSSGSLRVRWLSISCNRLQGRLACTTPVVKESVLHAHMQAAPASYEVLRFVTCGHVCHLVSRGARGSELPSDIRVLSKDRSVCPCSKIEDGIAI